MIRRTIRPFAGLALLLSLLLGASILRAQDAAVAERSARSVEIHEAIAARGIPIVSVRCRDGRYELVLGPACTEAQRLEAQALRDTIAAQVPPAIAVTSVEDALVVLRFEPMNPGANRIVRERYEQLRAAARQGR